jgi:hypothetical protein
VGPVDPEAAQVDRTAEAVRLARELLDDGMRPSAVAKEVSARLDVARNEAYRIVQEQNSVGADDE